MQKLKDQSVILKRQKLEIGENGKKTIEDAAEIKKLKDHAEKISKENKNLKRKLEESKKTNVNIQNEYDKIVDELTKQVAHLEVTISQKSQDLTSLRNMKNKCNVDEHKRILSGDKPFTCQQCTQNFTPPKVISVPSVEEHKRILSGDKPITSEEDKRILSEDKHITCKQCTQTFKHTCHNSPTCPEEHKRILSRDKPFTCQQCAQTFTPPITPVTRVTEVKPVPKKCIYCSTKYVTDDKMRNHMKADHTCPRCKKVVGTINQVLDHLDASHRGIDEQPWYR